VCYLTRTTRVLPTAAFRQGLTETGYVEGLPGSRLALPPAARRGTMTGPLARFSGTSHDLHSRPRDDDGDEPRGLNRSNVASATIGAATVAVPTTARPMRA
jgi:hypothetical protein